MATLQKFKLLATQCAVAGSPTRSPTTSPVIHIRRRKTLRMLLGRGGGRRLPPRHDDCSPDRQERRDDGSSPEKSISHKLKDLFVSSPPAFGDRVTENVREGLLQSSGGGGGVRRGGARSLRPLTATFRQRLLRKAWRPVLVAIPEEHF
ncbi:hypothetical protein BUALT_Bualt11G0057200 [Buddleja alternifolia]|uniref:Uncharacterized protein n=1 Tax=Buddleja alternifolia TaxID=168488 RepID=A0AAV6X3N7_9LAMI|nr:hypothetical protein BUALT_Bualt11G0057200 [Buddleja alternifolia]